MKSFIALVDCNSFFCSCELLFNPRFYHRPVVVLSTNDGCAISLTKEAKALGIAVGDPYFQFKRVLEAANGKAFSSNFTLYADISSRVMRTVSEVFDQIEIYSIDEVFIDLTTYNSSLIKCHESAQMIKNKIEKNIGIPVSVGVSTTKVLAKVANQQAKKVALYQGICVLPGSGREVENVLEGLLVKDVWGVGPKSAKKLHLINIQTALDLRNYSDQEKIRRMLTKTGVELQQELQGVSCLNVERILEKKQSMVCSRTFSQSLYDLRAIKENIAEYTSSVAFKLRRQKSVCSYISIYLITKQADYLVASLELRSATSDTRDLIKAAMYLVDQKFQKGKEYKKAGVMMSRFADQESMQPSLFSPSLDKIKSQKLMTVMDKINVKEGRNFLKVAQCGVDALWKGSSNLRSKAYTTRWGELLEVGEVTGKNFT